MGGLIQFMHSSLRPYGLYGKLYGDKLQHLVDSLLHPQVSPILLCGALCLVCLAATRRRDECRLPCSSWLCPRRVARADNLHGLDST